MTTESTSGHFAEDEEHLGFFVLGKLGDAERSAAELHLATCESCRQAVQKERLLAAGGKYLGREMLRSSLRERIQARTPSTVPWPKIVSAAAIIGIVIGIGIYSEWFSTGHIPGDSAQKPSALSEAGKTRPEDSLLPAAPADEERRNETAAPASAPRPLEGRKGELSLNAGARQPGQNQRAATESEVSSRIAAPAAVASKTAPSKAPGKEFAQTGMENARYWTEGVLISPPLAVLKRTDSLTRSEEAAKRPDFADSKDKKNLNQVSTPATFFRVIRHPPAYLPTGHLRSKEAWRIPALVEQRGDTTLLTLFVDSGRTELDDQRVEVIPSGPDSVVVRLGDRLIGLHLLPSHPAGHQ
jgi:hypothetical protein